MKPVSLYLKKLSVFKYLFTAILSAIVLVGTIVLVALPIYNEHFVWEQEQKVLEKRLEVLESFAASDNKYEAIKKKQVSLVTKLREKLPDTLTGGEDMGLLQQAAKNNKLTLSTKRIIQKHEQQKQMISTGVELKAVGSYNDIISFLEYIEKHSLTGLENIKIEADKSKGVTLTGKCFVQALPKN